MPKALWFLGDSLKAMKQFPENARRTAGFSLYSAQQGMTPDNAKALRHLGVGIHGVMEIVLNENSDTYRVVYIAKFRSAVYVLHAFQKKSTKGIATPKSHIDLIISRYKDALLQEGNTG